MFYNYLGCLVIGLESFGKLLELCVCGLRQMGAKMSKFVENSKFRKMNEEDKKYITGFELARTQNIDHMYIRRTQA